MARFEWTEDLKTQGKQLVHDGHTIASIADTLGCTPNTISKAKRDWGWRLSAQLFAERMSSVYRRMGWNSGDKSTVEARQRAQARELALTAMDCFVEAEPGQGKTLTELRMLYGEEVSDCRWPLSAIDNRTERFCGEPTNCRGPYCESHHKLAYRKVGWVDKVNLKVLEDIADKGEATILLCDPV